MSVFAAISLLAAIMTAALGTFVLYRNPRGPLNRVFFLYCLAGSAASFAEFEYRKAESFDASLFWMQASAAWILSIPLELHFLLRFTGRTKLLGSKLAYPILYAPAAAALVAWAAGLIPLQPVGTDWGWTYVRPEESGLLDLLGAYAAITTVCGLCLCARYFLREAEGKKKRQAGLILIGLITTVFLVVLTEPGLPFGSVQSRIPRLTSLGFVIECAGVALAMWRHRLFALSPTTAAESIMETLTDSVLLVDSSGKIVAANSSALELLGYQESELAHQPVASILPDQEASRSDDSNTRQPAWMDSTSQIETVLLAKRGRQIPISLSTSVVQDDEDADYGVVYVARDLTQRKRAEEQIEKSLREKEVLLREIHHRVRNNLQLISSLLMLQSEEYPDERTATALRTSRNRIQSMAVIHETLYQCDYLANIDLADCIRNLVDHLAHTYDVDADTITTEVDVGQVTLSADLVVQCGLIINELVSNAFKHAFPAGRTGTLSVAVYPDGNDNVILTISDNGVSLPPEVSLPKADSLGLQLVHMLIQQLAAEIEVDRSAGTTFKIRFST
jgi:PAS domain S-box-containing protein